MFEWRSAAKLPNLATYPMKIAATPLLIALMACLSACEKPLPRKPGEPVAPHAAVLDRVARRAAIADIEIYRSLRSRHHDLRVDLARVWA
jgi:hypothetical protein